jgi:hypothetical protein
MGLRECRPPNFSLCNCSGSDQKCSKRQVNGNERCNCVYNGHETTHWGMLRCHHPALRGRGRCRHRSDTAQRGCRTAITSADEDTALVHSTVSKLAEAGRDVVVVVHSYGGIPGSDAMKGLAREERSGKGLRGEVALVYIYAWMLQQGK